MYRHRMTTKSCSISSPSWTCSSSSCPWTFQASQLSGHRLPSFCWTWGSFSRTRKMTSPVILISLRFWTLLRSNQLPSSQVAFRRCPPPEEVADLFCRNDQAKRKFLSEYKHTPDRHKWIYLPFRLIFSASRSVRCFPAFNTTTCGRSSTKSSSSSALPGSSLGRSGMAGRLGIGALPPPTYSNSSSSSSSSSGTPLMRFWSF